MSPSGLAQPSPRANAESHAWQWFTLVGACSLLIARDRWREMLNRYQNRYRADRAPLRAATFGKRVAVNGRIRGGSIHEETGAGLVA